MQPTDHKPPHAARSSGPDLLRKSAAAPRDDSRILARLEHGDAAFAPVPSSQFRAGRVAAVVLVIAVLAGVLAWTFYQNAAPTLDMRSLPAGVTVPLNSVASAPATIAAKAQPAAQPPEPAAAAIVNETPTTPTARTTPAPGHAPVPSQARPTPNIAAASPKSATPARPSKVPATPAPSAARAAGVASTAHGKPETGAADGDVTLLTALVAHANNQTVPAPSDVTPPVNRDVVQGQPGETTESLLHRCKQLGLIEGMLCRARICSGRWDSEPACKSHP